MTAKKPKARTVSAKRAQEIRDAFLIVELFYTLVRTAREARVSDKTLISLLKSTMKTDKLKSKTDKPLMTIGSPIICVTDWDGRAATKPIVVPLPKQKVKKP